MEMSFQEIAAVALDEWESGNASVSAETPAEDGLKFPKLGGGTKPPSANPPKPPSNEPKKAPTGPKKMGASEKAQAQAMAGQSDAQKDQSLMHHDKIYHKGNYDPTKSTCSLRKKLVETQIAIGHPLSAEQAKTLRISDKDLHDGASDANKKIGAVVHKEENADPMLTELKDLQKKAKNLPEGSEERKKADEEAQAKCIEFAKKNLGEAEGEAVQGLFNKMAVMGRDIAQKVKDAFAKRDESKMSEAAKEVKGAVVGRADEIIEGSSGDTPSDGNPSGNTEIKDFGGEGTGSFQFVANDKDGNEIYGIIKANNRNEAIKAVMEQGLAPTAMGQQSEAVNPETPAPTNPEPQDNTPQFNNNRPAGQIDGVQRQALEETIASLDPDAESEELSDYEKDRRKTDIANRATHYLDDWLDLDDPEKREAAVQMAIQDVVKARSEGTKLSENEEDIFTMTAQKGRGDLQKDLDDARKHLDDVFRDKNASEDEKRKAREDFLAAKKANEERLSTPTEEDLFEDCESAKKDVDEKNGLLDEANEQLRRAEERLNAAKDTGDKDAIKNAEETVEKAKEMVAEAEQAKADAENAYNEANERFENYEAPKTETDELVDRTKEALTKAGISEESLKRFEAVERILKADPSFYKDHPDLIDGFKKDAEAWTRIKTDNPAMQEVLTSLKDVAADSRTMRMVSSYYDEAMKSDNADIVQAARIAKHRIANGEDPHKVQKDFSDERRRIESHASKMSTEAARTNQINSKTENDAMAAKGKEASRVAEEARKGEKLQMAKDKEEDRKRHQKFQEDLAKSKDAYKRAQDAKKELPDTAAKMNPGVVQAIADARDNCKDPINRGELDQVITNLKNTRDPGKALQWLNKADQIIKGRSNKRGATARVETPVSGVDHDNGGVMGGGGNLNYRPVDTSSLTRVKDSNGKLNGEASAKSHISQVCANNGLSNANISVKQGATDTRMTIDLRNFTGNGQSLGAKILSGIGNVVGTEDADGKTKEPPSYSYDDNTKRLTISFPNDKKGEVSFTGVLDDKRWHDFKDKNKGKGSFFVGKNDDGEPISGTFDDMVHLLIAGETGSGKSVKLNTLLSSAIEGNSPDDLKLIMIDPKGVELANYEGDPHVIGNVITDMDDAAGKFNWAANEMDNRYKLLQRAGVRDIQEYNKKSADGTLPPGLPKKLPRIGVVVEEFADLMATHKKDVESAIARLSSKARAAGIHLVIATQRPDSKVVTGVIKANIPSRMALHTADATNSYIIGVKGAEALTSKGPFILKTPDGNIRRGEGAMISNEDNKKLIEASKKAYGVNASPVTPAPAAPQSPATPKPSSKPTTPKTNENTNSSAPTATTSTPATPASTTESKTSTSSVALSPQDLQGLGLKQVVKNGDLSSNWKLRVKYDVYSTPNHVTVTDNGRGGYKVYSVSQKKFITLNSEQLKKFVGNGVRDPAGYDQD